MLAAQVSEIWISLELTRFSCNTSLKKESYEREWTRFFKCNCNHEKENIGLNPLLKKSHFVFAGKWTTIMRLGFELLRFEMQLLLW